MVRIENWCTIVGGLCEAWETPVLRPASRVLEAKLADDRELTIGNCSSPAGLLRLPVHSSVSTHSRIPSMLKTRLADADQLCTKGTLEDMDSPET